MPDTPTDLTKPSWKYIARKTFREFSDDQCTDLAAALTYYAMMSLFPALLLMVLAGKRYYPVHVDVPIASRDRAVLGFLGNLSLNGNLEVLLEPLSGGQARPHG